MSAPRKPMTDVVLTGIAADIYDEINVLGTRHALDDLLAEARRARAREERLAEEVEIQFEARNEVIRKKTEVELTALRLGDELARLRASNAALVEALKSCRSSLAEQGHSRYCKAAESDNPKSVLCDCGLAEQVRDADAALADAQKAGGQ